MEQTNTWTCPACGSRVRLSADLGGSADPPDRERLDRLAHAVCGCYVLQMPAGLIGRLLASVLAAGSGDDVCPPDEAAAPDRVAPERATRERPAQEQVAPGRDVPTYRRVSERSAGRR